MSQQAIGFYWTLPVPWAGFAVLPEDVDEAAEASRTIRYQRDAVRYYAKQNGFQLVTEKVFLEIAPDRGSDLILGPLSKVEKLCREQAAVLLFVDFAEVQGWRSHAPMTEWSRQSGIEVVPIFPNEMLIEGKVFDPSAHFQKWRARQYEWSAGKPARRARALSRAMELRAKGLSNPEIAAALNSENVPSVTGKVWTGETVRKLGPEAEKEQS
ncbi:hypothetical protein ACEUZ9_005396 [Paracoccus litorisediminis]|uniref:hypothetical protein n=1 Tax=Paracoccus litorisediminis TaxID=2006130 RepID=UPI0037333F97